MRIEIDEKKNKLLSADTIGVSDIDQDIYPI